MARESERIRMLQQRLIDGLTDIEQTFLNGHAEQRVPHNVNMSFNFVEGESLIMGIKGIAVSSGSACTSASLEPSYVLRALGRSDELAHSSLRMTIGRFTTDEEIDYVVDHLEGPRRQAARAVAAVGHVQGRRRHQHHPVGRALERIKSGVRHGIQRKSRRALREPAQRRFLRQGRRHGRHRHGRRAGLRRRDEAADQGQPETGLIEDAKFKTYGCGSAIASSSLVTEWVKGKSLDEALTIKNTHIAEELALPPVKIHCSILAEDAIKAAVNDYKAKTGAARPLQRRRIEPMAVTLTEAAARHVTRYIGKRGKGVGVRLGVKTTGCSGLAYKLEYADDVAPEDVIFEGHGVKVLVDPKSLPYIDGTELDFVREGLNEGFKFHNPREKDRCGCGESFRV